MKIQFKIYLGIVFSRTDEELGWLSDSVKQIHIFTDNPFHYYGDDTGLGFNGSVTPPLEKWTTQPAGLYRYYDKSVVTAFTRGCNWDGQACGPDFNSDWAIDQLFFNLVSCNGSCKQLYIETFDLVPTELEDWVPETGLIDTGNGNILIYIAGVFFTLSLSMLIQYESYSMTHTEFST